MEHDETQIRAVTIPETMPERFDEQPSNEVMGGPVENIYGRMELMERTDTLNSLIAHNHRTTGGGSSLHLAPRSPVDCQFGCQRSYQK